MQANHFDLNDPSAGPFPSQGIVVFPLIVVDAEIFEVHYEQPQDAFEIRPTDSARLYWRGSKAHHHWIAPVDIVRLSALDNFVQVRRDDCIRILEKSEAILESIKTAFEKRSFSSIEIKPEPRGYVGLPPLLADLYRLGPRKKVRSISKRKRPR